MHKAALLLPLRCCFMSHLTFAPTLPSCLVATRYHISGMFLAAELQRQQVETVRKADYQALAAAKRSGHLATIQFQLDLPPELNDIELTERWVDV
jgi:hypothetical protein